MVRLLQVAELPGSDLDLGQSRQISATGRTRAVNRLSVGGPRRAVILHIALMRREMLDFPAGHVNCIEVLVVIGLHPISQDPPVIKRPAKRKVIAAGTFMKKTCLGELGCVSARSDLLNI